MPDRIALDQLRRDPAEWRRRGLTPPADLEAIVRSRVGHGVPAEPTYADFFTG
ncbi:hypothetical protein ACLBWP_06650 [Microbacterium sp. M1A1_1b]|uniref:hypothetical protein n=1 Tax=Curtobacterium sp. VKM Ac-2922 TaxID=2929475 RepID=UPI001FB3BB91|nr:hypothetical protein [Curtobacterium sp. VKM Ac-2922]MCJ1714746.1 hypothetical protein [Curtobacterium sp. VKM Ac-2922]